MSAAELRAAAQACEQRALNAFRSNAILTARDDLQAARLFDERADRAECQRDTVGDLMASNMDLRAALKRIDNICQVNSEPPLSNPTPAGRLANVLHDIIREALQ